MLVISTSVRNGVQAALHTEGDWRFERVGWVHPWKATHVPSGTVIDTKQAQLEDARRVARETAPDLFAAETNPAVSYTVARGRQSAARPGQRGEPQ